MSTPTERLARIIHWLQERDGCGHAETLLDDQPGGPGYRDDAELRQNYARATSRAVPPDDWNALDTAERAKWIEEARIVVEYLARGPS